VRGLLFAVFDAETVAQLTANGIFRGAAYGILGVGFALILGVTGRFHFAYAFTYTLAAYMAYTFVDRVGGLPFWFASMLGVVLVAFVGTGIERFIYRPLANRAGATALLAIFVASLGITIAGENLIRLFWSSSSQNLLGPDQIAYSIWEVNFLNFDVWQAASSFGCVVVLALLLRYTPLGRAIKATRANPELARTIGIDSGQIYLICFFIGTLLCGLAAFWYGLQFTIDPAMGLKPVIFAFVVAFLAGTASSPIRVFFTGIAVSLLEQYSSIWLSVRWTQTAVFVVLVIYLSWQSLRSTDPVAWVRAKLARI
jgi:branched-subunit amino acid ABC-type transport system permease component